MPCKAIRSNIISRGFVSLTSLLFLLFSLFILVPPAYAADGLEDFIGKVTPAEIMPGADQFGPLSKDVAAMPVLRDGETIGWVFLTSDFVPTTGYSGKPIHVLAGISLDAVITGVRLVKHSEPIVLVGIPEARITEVIEKYAGLDLKAEVSGESVHELDIVSGATVTIMVIDDSIIRAGIKVARILELGNFSLNTSAPTEIITVRRDIDEVRDWETLAGDGSLRRIIIDVETINAEFKKLEDPRTEKNAEPAPNDDAYVDVWTALISQPSIGRSLLGDDEYANLKKRMKEGDEAILILGDGRWSFKGSGYVRGGIFDRFQLIEGEISHRFRDREHKRLVRVAAEGAPEFTEADVFIIPAKSEFNPASDWRLQFLLHRPIGPIEKVFLTYELGYTLPDHLLDITPVSAPVNAQAATVGNENAEAIRNALWVRIWEVKQPQIIALSVAMVLLTGIFFFQGFFTRNERIFNIVRTSFLIFTLFYIGWYANAQLSVVNVMAIFSALVSDFRWETFLMDPLIFILWASVAAALIFWGRGAYCGWLCPFGALQELTNKIARAFKIPQITLPWGLHERLWPIKYMIFLGLFGLSLYSIEMAEFYAEIEPFKTAIILKFARPAPYVLFAIGVLIPGLFIERFYCRYMCPLGAGLAVPARMHMFRWLKRYKECGSPCQVCAKDCPVQAIHPTGEINPNECISCLNCQVLYQHQAKCPVVVARVKKQQRFDRQMGRTPAEATTPITAQRAEKRPLAS